MQNQSFKDIMQLEVDVTNKLLTYMHSKIDILDILEELDIDFSYMKDDRNNLALNIWLGVDYIDEEGKSFIDKLLEDKSVSLTKIEREILLEKSTSFVSLFEIIAFEDNHVILKDVLNSMEYCVLEPSIHNVIEMGEFLFTRIGNVLNNFIFMGDINYVPSLVKDIFLEELLLNYNLIRKEQTNLSMIDYLKRYSLNLYKIYNESLIDVIDSDGDINSFFFDELDEFEYFLLNKYKDVSVRKHITNLSNIFEYALADKDMTLYDIDKVNLNNFFSEAIKDGFINSHEDFNSYIATLKSYLQYLSIGDNQYKDSYSEILKISKDRFKYMSELDINNSFNLDRNLASLVTFNLDDQAISIVLDYDKFILYISDTDIKLTSTKKQIKRNDLININNMFENNIEIFKKAPNQEDFNLINLLFHASLNNGMFEIQGNDLILTNKGNSIIRLADEEKYALLVQYLLGNDFIAEVFNSEQPYIVEETKDNFIEKLSTLNVEKMYLVDELPLKFDFVFNNYINYLLDLGLILVSQGADVSIGVTNLGKKVFRYFNHEKKSVKDSQIIRLDDFKRSKINAEG
ncbi:MAG: hypothetical protein RIN55_01190 [Tissierellaceae bacterium]|nr:hypothetical protein [Tissierellaceae bacterium]